MRVIILAAVLLAGCTAQPPRQTAVPTPCSDGMAADHFARYEVGTHRPNGTVSFSSHGEGLRLDIRTPYDSSQATWVVSVGSCHKVVEPGYHSGSAHATETLVDIDPAEFVTCPSNCTVTFQVVASGQGWWGTATGSAVL